MVKPGQIYSQQAHLRLREVYERVDDWSEAHRRSCRRRAQCCRLSIESFVLCATELELDLLTSTQLPRENGGDCPYLQDGGCLRYPERPLACRLHSCDGGEDESALEVLIRAHNEILRIAAQDGRPAAWVPVLTALRLRTSAGVFYDPNRPLKVS